MLSIKQLDLFSDPDSSPLAADWEGVDTVGFWEIKESPRRNLAKNFIRVPTHEAIRELEGSEYAGIDVITGRYSYQSVPRERRKGGGRRLWPEMLRIIEQARHIQADAERVIGPVTLGIDEVLIELENNGDDGYTGEDIERLTCEAIDRLDRCLDMNP